MENFEFETPTLDEFFLKRTSKNIENMTNHDWATLVIDFFTFCEPYILAYKGIWKEMEQPEPYTRYDGFRFSGQSKWGQGTLKHLVSKQAAVYIDNQEPKIPIDAQCSMLDGLNWETGGRLLISAGRIEVRSPEDTIYASMHRKSFILVTEPARLLVCEILAKETDPWKIGWLVKECEISYASIENLEELFKKKKFVPQNLLRAIFEFTKEIIWAEQMRKMEERTKAFTDLFSEKIMSKFM